MLKLKLTTLEGLDAKIAGEYRKEGDVYVLDTDVKFEDTSALKNALAAEKDQRKQATEKVTALEESVATLTTRAGAAGDIEKAWEKKLADKEAVWKGKLDARESQLREVLVDSEATRIANEVAIQGAAELLVPHLTKRLKLEEVDGKLITRVLDSDGRMTALSVKEFQSEVVADKKFASILVGSKASGGGAQGGSAPAGGKAYKDMSEAERSQLARTDKPRFDSLRNAYLAEQKK